MGTYHLSVNLTDSLAGNPVPVVLSKKNNSLPFLKKERLVQKMEMLQLDISLAFTNDLTQLVAIPISRCAVEQLIAKYPNIPITVKDKLLTLPSGPTTSYERIVNDCIVLIAKNWVLEPMKQYVVPVTDHTHRAILMDWAVRNSIPTACIRVFTNALLESQELQPIVTNLLAPTILPLVQSLDKTSQLLTEVIHYNTVLYQYTLLVGGITMLTLGWLVTKRF